jgi:DNA polymerase-3 subunit beta
MAVVPAKAMRLLDRNLSADGPVRVAFRKNDVLMQTGGAVIYSRLVEGRFPNYKQVIPAKHNHRAPLIAGPILAAVRQAAVMADADGGNRVRFQFGKKKLTLRAQGAETGQSRVELLTEYDAGKKPFEISFDSAYLTDMLRSLEPDATLTLDMLEPETPAVFRHDPQFLYVVVPLSKA